MNRSRKHIQSGALTSLCIGGRGDLSAARAERNSCELSPGEKPAPKVEFFLLAGHQQRAATAVAALTEGNARVKKRNKTNELEIYVRYFIILLSFQMKLPTRLP